MREDVIRNKMTKIVEISNSISDHLPEDLDEFIDLDIVKDGIYKRMEYSVELIFDICSILNSDLKLGIPESDDTIITNLIRRGILDDKWEEKLRRMKGFRNILVHRYGRIDDSISFTILKEDLPDLIDFVNEVDSYLRGN
jgi:uncharacterized protein YutE (UPF0331/DUF86 family)